MSFWEVPAVVMSILLWFQTTPMSLADLAGREALRRQMMPKSVRSLTDRDVNGLPRSPLPTQPESSTDTAAPATATPAAPGAPPTAAAPAAHDEAWWRARVDDAQKTLERDTLLAEALQSRVNGLTADWSARDDPAQRQVLFETRQRVMDELQRMTTQLETDRKTVADIDDDARSKNVPAGWVR